MDVTSVLFTELQIRRGKRDNLGIIFNITPLKHVATHHKNPLAEMILMRGNNMFSLIRKIIFELSSIAPLIWNSECMHILLVCS